MERDYSQGGNGTPTQPNTLPVFDPRREGKQNSGFSDADIADIVCLLIPLSDGARAELRAMANRESKHMFEANEAVNKQVQIAHHELRIPEAMEFSQLVDHPVIALRLSSQGNNPLMGFTFGRFGRNESQCDIHFANDPDHRLSKVHFRIYYNEYGSLMIEDSSINGTIVDNILLKRKQKDGDMKFQTRLTLSSGNTVKLLMAHGADDLEFVVHIPRRDGVHEEAFRRNLTRHMCCLKALRERAVEGDMGKTITPGPGGHLDLFPANERTQLAISHSDRSLAETPLGRPWPSREWDGSDRYNKVGKIGRGAFATVYKVTSKFNGTPYAAKEIERRSFVKNGVLDQKVETEMKIMQRAKHPNIVEYMEHLEWDNRLMIIIMEFVPNRDLGCLISENTALIEAVVQQTASQLLSALSYLHSENITHRDVKPENILVASYAPFIVKLTDFGLSKIVDTEQTFLKTFCGTLLYCAPEVYNEFIEYDDEGHRHPRNRMRRRPTSKRYDHAVDIWSLGCVLYYTLTAFPPFPAKDKTSHAELLNRIMTRPVDTAPLIQKKISKDGVEFLLNMLVRRPEERATTEDLRRHPWMKDQDFSREGTTQIDSLGSSQEDEEIDKALERASQLSLNDTAWAHSGLDGNDNKIDMDQDEDEDTEHGDDGDGPQPGDEDDDGIENTHGSLTNSDKENYTFGQVSSQPKKLYGEVSAVGSSGDLVRLNLSLSARKPAATQMLNSVIKDSFGSEDSTPRQERISQATPRAAAPPALSQSQRSASIPSTECPTSFDTATHDMASRSPRSPSRGSLANFNTSKRKTALNSSDEFGSTSRMRPPVKRLRSENIMEAMGGDVETDLGVYLLVPPLPRKKSSRQIDKVVHKFTYWNSREESWHLRYPEMTQLQYEAFASAARKQGEVFAKGQTPLWNLAMKHFPPGGSSSGSGSTSHSSESSSASDLSLEVSSRRYSRPSTEATLTGDPADEEMPDTLADRTTVTGEPPLNKIVATLESTPGSAVLGISISIDAGIISWGRGTDNIQVYTDSQQVQVPKHALKMLLWKDGYEPGKNFRPWNKAVASDGFFFYISTKATHGISVNSTSLPSVEPKNFRGPSWNWIRLHDGDTIVFWKDGNAEHHLKAKLTFRCNWGGSSLPRLPRDGAAEIVPKQTANCLDAAYQNAENRYPKLMKYDRCIKMADLDAFERHINIERECRRSWKFEIKRREVCQELAKRASGRNSPVPLSPIVPSSSTPPASTSDGNEIVLRRRSASALKQVASTSTPDGTTCNAMLED